MEKKDKAKVGRVTAEKASTLLMSKGEAEKEIDYREIKDKEPRTSEDLRTEFVKSIYSSILPEKIENEIEKLHIFIKKDEPLFVNILSIVLCVKYYIFIKKFTDFIENGHADQKYTTQIKKNKKRDEKLDSPEYRYKRSTSRHAAKERMKDGEARRAEHQAAELAAKEAAKPSIGEETEEAKMARELQPVSYMKIKNYLIQRDGKNEEVSNAPDKPALIRIVLNRSITSKEILRATGDAAAQGGGKKLKRKNSTKKRKNSTKTKKMRKVSKKPKKTRKRSRKSKGRKTTAKRQKKVMTKRRKIRTRQRKMKN